jgi:hypothetical protein
MRISRPLVALVAAAASTTLVAGLTSPASAATYDGKPTAAGARWLSSQLTDGVVHNEQFDFDDWALTIDFTLGLDAAGRKPALVEQLTTKIADNVTSYTEPFGDTYAGNLGKAAVLAIVGHRDPRSFGGQDLIAKLEGRVSSTAPIVGRIEDLSAFADSANVFGQAHAARALNTADSPKAADALAFLLEQQCDKGFFRQSFTTDKAAVDQSCQGAPAAERTPSTDATALAVLSLTGVKGPGVKPAIDNAVDWLVGHQRANGSFSDDGRAKSPANANSTGLAGWALGEARAARPAAKAATWLRNLQVPAANPCARRLRTDVGAIAYDAAAYRKGQRKGISVELQDQWRRASSQALPALVWAPDAEGRFTAKAPSTVGAGDRLRISITGAAPGERVCVTGGGIREYLGKRQAITQVAFTAPTNPGRRTYKVWLGNRVREVSVRVTG